MSSISSIQKDLQFELQKSYKYLTSANSTLNRRNLACHLFLNCSFILFHKMHLFTRQQKAVEIFNTESRYQIRKSKMGTYMLDNNLLLIRSQEIRLIFSFTFSIQIIRKFFPSHGSKLHTEICPLGRKNIQKGAICFGRDLQRRLLTPPRRLLKYRNIEFKPHHGNSPALTWPCECDKGVIDSALPVL